MPHPVTSSRAARRASSLAPLLSMALALQACVLFEPVATSSCDELPTTCTCSDGSLGRASCDPDQVVITGCDCSASTSSACDTQTPSMCSCQSGALTHGGISSCDDSNSCICAPYEPSQDGASPWRIPQAASATTITLDGACGEYTLAAHMPALGERAPMMPSMGCRVMWRPQAGVPTLYGCCLVLDDTYREATISETEVDLMGVTLFDRLEVLVSPMRMGAVTAERSHLIVALREPALSYLSVQQASDPATASSFAISSQRAVRRHQTAAGEALGYQVEWAMPLPMSATSGPLACQVVRHDLTAGSQSALETAFGTQQEAASLEAWGECELAGEP